MEQNCSNSQPPPLLPFRISSRTMGIDDLEQIHNYRRIEEIERKIGTMEDGAEMNSIQQGVSPVQIQGVKVSPCSSNSSSTFFCRICHEGESFEILLAPCQCTGTVALIHKTCLEHWLTSSNSDKCEICKFQYSTSREPRSCIEYVQDSGNQFNVRNLIADIVCFFLLTPLLVVSTYLCIIGANQYFLRERWEAVGLIVLSLFLISVYLTWCHVTIKFHLSVWLTWQRTNQRVRLLEIVNRKDNPSNTDHDFVDSRLLRPTICQIQISSNETNERMSRIDFDEESDNNECDTSRIIV